MTVRRRREKRRAELTPEQEAWLVGDFRNAGFFKFTSDLDEFWATHSERIILEHVKANPGTRPFHWWRLDAPRMAVGTFPRCFYDGQLPEPRKRLGGVGTPCYECLAYVPSFSFGIPNSWLDKFSERYYRGTAKDIHGNPIGAEYFGKGFTGLAIDPEDPPVYESQAAYLKRHNLFYPGEAKRLIKSDFEPERISE